MKRAAIFLIAFSLHAATYYVASASSTPAGNDANPGSISQPWLTLQHAASSVACGDTINIVADGHSVAGDTNLPNAPCSQKITVQSSRLSRINTVPGFRTNPANDSANYGKLTFTSNGIQAIPMVWTTEYPQNYAAASFDTSGNWVTITSALAYTGLANGMQVELETFAEGNDHIPNIVAPAGLSFLQHYFVVNCGAQSNTMSVGYPQSCGQLNSRFQLASSPGGTPLSLGTCGPPGCFNTVFTDPSGPCSPSGSGQYNLVDSTFSYCNSGTWGTPPQFYFNYIDVGVTLNVDTVGNTITIPHNYGSTSYDNGMRVSFAAAGFLSFGTLPAPLRLDTAYYIKALTGSTFSVAATLGGATIPLTSNGTGMVSMSSVDIATNWSFLGLEMSPNGTSTPIYLLLFGNSTITSTIGMPSGMEVGWSYLHDNPPTQGIVHAVVDNSSFLNIHDSWIIGANQSEAQAISGTGSPGPTLITNNFLEAAGEVTLYGGDWPASGIANANKLFSGNYFYKPPIWKVSTGTVVANGPCLYDPTDPTHPGGEWYRNATASQNYQCGSDFLWHATATALPASPIIKDMTEHKNGRYFSYIGNLYNYSISQDQSGQVWNNSAEWGSGPGAANDHITIMNNAAYNVFTFMSRAIQCDATVGACPVTPGNHVTANNLAVFNPLVCGTAMSPVCGFGNASTAATVGGVVPSFNYDSWNHNTLWYPDTWNFGGRGILEMPTPNGTCGPFSPIPYTLITFDNSLVAWDMVGDCFSAGALLAAYVSNSSFSNNGLKAGTSGGYGSVGASNTWTNTVYPATNAAIKFVNGDGTINGDYHLDPTSPYSAASGSATRLATDGTDLGADIDLVRMATSGAAAGTPPWDRKAGLLITAGSTQLVFRYQAPSTAACTATLYNSPVRVTANQVASVADSSANSISDVLTRQLYISGLTPLTQYWYKLACGGGVLMVGNVSTRATGHQNLQFSFDWSTPTPMQYSSSRNMSSAVSLPAATRQYIPVAANSLVYVETGVAGPITMLIAP